MADPVIIARDLTKSFGKVQALRGLSLEVERGTIVVILGPNGAGKSTLVRTLTTLLRPDSGSGSVAGFDILRQSGQLRSVIGLAGQYAAVDEHLTGRENLFLVARLYHIARADAKDRVDDLLAHVDLTEAADRPTKGYSGGMRRRLDLAAAMIADPEVLFLDEPTSGLDPPSRIQLWAMVETLRDQGRTVLLTTQNLEEAERLADRLVVVDKGTIIADGTVAQLKSKVGGDVVEIAHDDPTQLASVEKALRATKVAVEHVRGRLRVAAPKGAQTLAAVLSKIPAAALASAEVALRRPTLDDVFLALTGHGAEDQAEGKGKPKKTEVAA